MSTPFPEPALRRRHFVLGLPLVAWLAPSLAHGEPAPSRLAFVALREARPIGQQQTTFERRGETLIVRTVAEMTVRLGPVPLYRYRHEATELWEGGRFAHLETQTQQNGRKTQVSAERGPSAVSILTSAEGRVSAPATAIPFSHWNQAVAIRPLFNPQDGKLLREQVSAPQPASTLLANGGRIPTTRFVFRGDADIHDDYDQNGTWAGLAGKLKDGSTLEYRRT